MTPCDEKTEPQRGTVASLKSHSRGQQTLAGLHCSLKPRHRGSGLDGPHPLPGPRGKRRPLPPTSVPEHLLCARLSQGRRAAGPSPVLGAQGRDGEGPPPSRGGSPGLQGPSPADGRWPHASAGRRGSAERKASRKRSRLLTWARSQRVVPGPGPSVPGLQADSREGRADAAGARGGGLGSWERPPPSCLHCTSPEPRGAWWVW